MRVFSFGGGVQSTAALVLAARGELDVDSFLFANVGEDSENPGTLRYVSEIAKPFAKQHHISLIELQKRRRDGRVETLYGRLTRPGSRSIGIPVRLKTSGAPANRTCTQDFKIRVIAKWCYAHGARKTKPATTMLGISLDEWQRMRTDSGITYTRLEYPLIDRRLRRQDCMNLIAQAGLPIPPKSSCWFCPYHRMTAWRDLRDHDPALFAKAVDLEQLITDRLRSISPRPNDACYFTDKLKPLPIAVGDAKQPSLFDEDNACESGYCMV